jgi:hypothetical protein
VTRRPDAASHAAIVTLAASLAIAIAAPLAAQVAEPPVVESRPPGWTITPSISVSSAWDDNPLIAAEGSDVRRGDYVTAVRPALTTGLRGRRTAFTLGYNGSFDFYRDLGEQDTRDHRGSVDFSHQLTRRVRVFATDQGIFSPTTADAAALGVAVLRKQTTRMNTFRGGFDATPARHTTFTAAYATQWVDFEADEEIPAVALFQGGHSHGGSGSLRQQLSPRVALGADYDVQRALVGSASQLFDVQSVLAVAEVAVARHVEANFAYGHAWLFTGDGERHNGPAFRLGLEWQGRRAAGSVRYARAFLPSFGFGGTFQNEELRADLNVPFGRWVAWGGGLAATRSDPLTEGDLDLLGLRGTSMRSSLAVTVKRKLRIEAFGSHVFQNSTAGGRVHRTRLGVQASVATLVRTR